MKQFLNVSDIGDLGKALEEAKQVKKTPFAWQDLGHNKTIILVFFNNSLRTRLSSQKAAQNLGMNPIVLNVNGDSWKPKWASLWIVTSRNICVKPSR